MAVLGIQADELEEPLEAIVNAARQAWQALLVAKPDLLRQAPPRPQPTAKERAQRARQREAERKLDAPTALVWHDEVTQFYLRNPRSATESEILSAYADYKRQYLFTKLPLPTAEMLPLGLSMSQWREVFCRAGWIKNKERQTGGPQESPPPFNLFLSLAQNQVKLRRSIEHKAKRLAAARRAYRPSEPS